MTTGGFSPKRLGRVREVLERYVDSGFVPGAVAAVARHGEVHIEVTGNLAVEGTGSGTPMAADTICRLAFTTKPVVAACAMTLVEDCTLRLDDPIDEFLPELANMRVLAEPDGPLADTVPAARPVTLRDLLTFTCGTGMVPAEPGTVPIADALDALRSEETGQAPASSCETAIPADEWIRRLGTLPLVFQPGERWLYNTAANVTGVLVARATGMSFGQALHERICGPLGMKDTGFSVPAESIGRLATLYRGGEVTGEAVVEDGPGGYWSRPPAQKAVSGCTPGYFDDFGWGFGMAVRTRRTHLGPSAGSYGWNGGYGIIWDNDPAADMTAILMHQGGAGRPTSPIFLDFFTAAYQAIDD